MGASSTRLIITLVWLNSPAAHLAGCAVKSRDNLIHLFWGSTPANVAGLVLNRVLFVCLLVLSEHLSLVLSLKLRIRNLFLASTWDSDK